MLEKMLNSKDNIWKENWNSKSLLKEPSQKKLDREAPASQPFTLPPESEPKFKKEDSPSNTQQNSKTEKEMLKSTQHLKTSKFSMAKNMSKNKLFSAILPL